MIKPLFRFGFGLEQLGSLAARHRMIFTLLILTATLVSAWMLPALKFDGDVETLLKSDRQAYADYQKLVDNFPEFTNSITLHVTSGDRSLISKSGLENLADFQLELALLDPVEQVISPLSLREFDPKLGRMVPLIPSDLPDDQAALKAAEAVLSNSGGLAGLISIKADSAMILIVLPSEHPAVLNRLPILLKDIDQAAENSGLTVLKTGRATIQAELVGHLIRDQIVVTLLGIAAGIIIAFFVFRDWRAVVLCSGTASLALLWTLGAMAVLGRPLDAMTTILPILGSILAFADGLHLLTHWRRRLFHGEQPKDALMQTIREIGPATGLTSITTALAFGSMALAGPALANFSIFGVLTVAIAFISSIIALPVGCTWMATGFVVPGASGALSGRWLASITSRSALKYPRAIALGSMVLIGVFSMVHFAYQPSFSPVENLPADSQARQAESALLADFGGSDRIFALVPVNPNQPGDVGNNMQRLLAVHEAMAYELGDRHVASVAGLLRETNVADIPASQLDELVQASLSRDGLSHLVIGTIPGAGSAAVLKSTHARLSSNPAFDGVTVTGFPVMTAFEATFVIERLKSGLLLAVILAAGIVGLVCRSFRVFIAVAAANLAVVLLIETGAWAIGLPGEFALYIALTIALGIGIDDSVHILNLMRHSNDQVPTKEAIRRSITRAAPALVGSTVVLCANILVTAVSVLPVVSFIGLTVSLTLAFALIANVIILPSMLAAGRKQKA